MNLLLQLLVFKLIGAVFPTSDFRHPVVTPAMLLMAQLLQKVHVCSIAIVCYMYMYVYARDCKSRETAYSSRYLMIHLCELCKSSAGICTI